MNRSDAEKCQLGLGCWPIGGKMFAADGTSLGYSNTTDKESIAAIQVAVSNGITVFDTAAAYGAGHSEELLGKALKNLPDIKVVTKIGIGIDEATQTLTGEELDANTVMPAIDNCLRRLNRESVDLLLLHPNTIPDTQVHPLFDAMELARQRGKIQAYGWSTDYVENATRMANRDGFVAVEHAMHVLMDAPAMQSVVQKNKLIALIRSPLAMGLLTGKYTIDSKMPSDDIRATKQDWTGYYIDGKPNPDYISRFQQVRELLQSNGRTAVQGALAWLWGKSAFNLPVPGARTAKQVEELAAAMDYGALPTGVMAEVSTLLDDRFVCDGKSPR